MERYEAAYARQSVEKKDSLSIQAQLDLCRKASANDGVKTYQDRGYSGKNTDRPAFQRLLRDIRADRISKLYVYRLDRFSRSIADFGQLWNVLREHDVEFVSVTESFDTSTPMGRAMLHIIMVFAQLERETTAERVKDNYDTRAATGAWPGGPAPYGYRNGRLRSGGGTVPSLLPDEALLPVVLRIFEEYAKDDASLGTVARGLNADGIPCSRRATWDNVSLSRLLHNPVYVMADEQVRLYYKAMGVRVLSPERAFDGVHGVLLYGKRNAGDRKYTALREQNAVVLNSVGVVPAEQWLRCQEKLARNRQLGNSGRGSYTWLTGLLKCAKCGYSLKVQTEKELLEPLFHTPSGDFDGVIFADSHRPFFRTLDCGYIMNTGSVGNSMGVPRAHALMLEGGDNGVLLSTILSVPYDNRLAANLAQQDPDLPRGEAYIREILTGIYSR